MKKLAIIVLTSMLSTGCVTVRTFGDIEHTGDAGRYARAWDRSLSTLGYMRQGRQDLPVRINVGVGQGQNINKRFTHGAYSNGATPENIPSMITDFQQLWRTLTR